MFLVLNLSAFRSQLSSCFTWWASWSWTPYVAPGTRYFMICIPSYWLWATKRQASPRVWATKWGIQKWDVFSTFVCQLEAFLKFYSGKQQNSQTVFCQLISKGASIFGGMSPVNNHPRMLVFFAHGPVQEKGTPMRGEKSQETGDSISKSSSNSCSGSNEGLCGVGWIGCKCIVYAKDQNSI